MLGESADQLSVAARTHLLTMSASPPWSASRCRPPNGYLGLWMEVRSESA